MTIVNGGLNDVHDHLIRSRHRESGVTAIEYSLIAALIAIGIVLTVVFVGTQVDATYTNIADKVDIAIRE